MQKTQLCAPKSSKPATIARKILCARLILLLCAFNSIVCAYFHFKSDTACAFGKKTESENFAYEFEKIVFNHYDLCDKCLIVSGREWKISIRKEKSACKTNDSKKNMFWVKHKKTSNVHQLWIFRIKKNFVKKQVLWKNLLREQAKKWSFESKKKSQK